jgi:hypothetical protein
LIRVNLLPDLVLNRRKEAQMKRLATLVLGGWLGAIGVLTVATLIYAGVQQALLNSATSKRDILNADVNSAANVAFRKEALEVQASLLSLEQLFNNQQRFSLINKRIAELTPKTVKINELIITSDKSVRLTGTAKSYAEAGKFLAALKESKPSTFSATTQTIYFEDAILVGASVTENGIGFSATANYVLVQPTGETK